MCYILTMELSFFPQAVILLGLTAMVVYLCHKIKVPAITGFLLTGLLAGPHGFSLIHDLQSIDALAELGVIMLLFTIGLEFSPQRLKKIRKFFFVGGFLQISLTSVSVFLILAFAGFSKPVSLLYGFLVSLSSTAVAIKLLQDRNEENTPHGNMTVGILLFQDLAVVPMLIAIPILASTSGLLGNVLVPQFLLKIILLLAAIFLTAYLLPLLTGIIVRSRLRELFIIFTLFLCLSWAWLTYSLGFSLALGAFIAGVLISTSDWRFQMASDILPFKEVFNGIFFISVGMLLDLTFVWHNAGRVLINSFAVIALKTLILFLVAKILQYPARSALLVAFSIFQIGEFSFVLARVAKKYELLPENHFQIFISIAVITIFITPLFLKAAAHIVSSGNKNKAVGPAGQKPEKELKNHVVIAGFGLNGRNLARVLQETAIPFVVIELNLDTVRECRRKNVPVVMGDVSSSKILQQAGIERAKVFVSVTSDARTALGSIRLSRQINRELFIIVRTRYLSEIDELYRLGANLVIPEEFETSIEIFAQTLHRFHIPTNVIDNLIKIVRTERYAVLRGRSPQTPKWEKLSALLKAGTVETFQLPADSPLAGRNLHELDLRRRVHTTIVAVVRGNDSHPSPGADFVLQGEDIMVLTASHENMDKAFSLLGNDTGLDSSDDE
ncbi:MAG: cation:proton antiporter [Acidobacteria bacterium]|nr:cation:proton antiporter [Acidobacteriota bacterium]